MGGRDGDDDESARRPPITAESRVIALLLLVYAMGVFGYVAATFAASFIGRDTGERQGVGELAERLEVIERLLNRLEQELRPRPRQPAGHEQTDSAPRTQGQVWLCDER